MQRTDGIGFLALGIHLLDLGHVRSLNGHNVVGRVLLCGVPHEVGKDVVFEEVVGSLLRLERFVGWGETLHGIEVGSELEV